MTEEPVAVQAPEPAPPAEPAPPEPAEAPADATEGIQPAEPAAAPAEPTAEPAAAPAEPARSEPTVDPAAARADAARAALGAVRAEVAKAVVGQDAAVTGLVIALVCRGHVLLEGVPGVAKTLLVRALAAALRLDTKRVQFTPDLMPGDVTGSLVYDASTAEFEFREGPVFTHLLLADEINRTPPKTQASLLEAMEERQVSVEGRPRAAARAVRRRRDPEPGRVRGHLPAARGPARPLPAQGADAAAAARDRARGARAARRRLRPARPRGARACGRSPARRTSPPRPPRSARVAVSPAVLGYVVDVVRATRVAPSVALGVSPRGATALLATSRAWAWLSGRDYVTPDDVKALARPTLRHRVQLRPEAELEGVTVDAVLETVLATVPVPR